MKKQMGSTFTFSLGAFSLALFLYAGSVFAQQAPAPGTRGIDPEYPTTIQNADIWQAYHRYQIMLEEMAMSISKKNAGLLSHDAGRWASYIMGMRTETAYWRSREFLDLPVSHGRDWQISDPLDLTCDFKDNTAICRLMALVVNARDELVLSASAGLPMHLYPADAERQESYWQAMEGYIEYLLTASPLDEPVTAAEERLGVEPGFGTGTTSQ